MEELKCWGVFKRGKLSYYDGIPLLYRTKKRADEEADIFCISGEAEEVRRVIVKVRELNEIEKELK